MVWKGRVLRFYHHNKIRKSGFYFIFQGKISSTQWISPVKDGFHCVALLRLRGFLHAFHLVEMTTKKTSSQPKSCHSEGLKNPKNLLERLSLRRSSATTILTTSKGISRLRSRWRYFVKRFARLFLSRSSTTPRQSPPRRHFDQVKRVEKSPNAKQCHNYSCHKQGDLSTTLEMTVLCQTFRKAIPKIKGVITFS